MLRLDGKWRALSGGVSVTHPARSAHPMNSEKSTVLSLFVSSTESTRSINGFPAVLCQQCGTLETLTELGDEEEVLA